jgi:hypothetical protein
MVKQEIGTRKFMLTVLWGVDGFCVVDLMAEWHSYNTQYFLDNILQAILRAIFARSWKPHSRWLSVYLDNCRVHRSKAADTFFIENGVIQGPRPVYSSDLAPSDFWLFGHIKASFAGQQVAGPHDLLSGIRTFGEEIQTSELGFVFHRRIERVRWVLENDGDYFDE